MRRWARTSMIFAVLLVSLLLASVLILHTNTVKNYVARRIEIRLQKEYNLASRIGVLNYQFFPLQLQISNLNIYSDSFRKRQFANLPFLRLTIPYSDLWRKELHVEEV